MKKILLVAVLALSGQAFAGNAWQDMNKPQERSLTLYEKETINRKDPNQIVASDLFPSACHAAPAGLICSQYPRLENGGYERLYVKKVDGKWQLLARSSKLNQGQAAMFDAQVDEDSNMERLMLDKGRKVLWIDPLKTLLTEEYLICQVNSGGYVSHGTSNFYACSCLKSYTRETQGYSLCTSNLAELQGAIGVLGAAVGAASTSWISGDLILPKKVDRSALNQVILDTNLSEVMRNDGTEGWK